MKKLIKKKVSLFGKEVSVFVLIIVGVVALASAALVPYLSGLMTATIGVSSPIEMEISNDGVTWIEDEDSIYLNDSYGGGSFEYYVRTNYIGNGSMDADINITISNSNDNVGLVDFVLEVNSSANFRGEANTANNWTDLGEWCFNRTGQVLCVMPVSFGNIPGDEAQVYHFRGEFAINVQPAQYIIETQAVPPASP